MAKGSASLAKPRTWSRLTIYLVTLAASMVSLPAGATLHEVPANDSFAGAQPIDDIPFTGHADNQGATREPGEPDCGNSAKSTVWFRYTPAHHLDILMQFSSAGGAVGSAIYTGSSVSNLSLVSCGYGHHLWTAEPGTTYYLQLGNTWSNGEDLIFMNLSFRHRVSGLVTDKNGVPQNRICADLRSETGQYRANIDLTDPDGRFEITAVRPGRYKLYYFDCDWFGSREFMPEYYNDVQTLAEAQLIELPDTKPSLHLAGYDAALTRGGTIGGTLTADGGWSHCVSAFRVGDQYPAMSTGIDRSDGGNYRITALAAGDYEVRFQECRSGDGGFIHVQDEWYDNVGSRELSTVIQVELETDINGIDAHLEAIPAPSNDDYQDAVEIDRLPFDHTQDVTAATIQPGEDQGCGSAHSVWFKITPSDPQMLSIQTWESNYSTGAALFEEIGQTGDMSKDLLFITCDDEGLFRGGFSRPLLPGKTYYVRIGHRLMFPEAHMGTLRLKGFSGHWVTSYLPE